MSDSEFDPKWYAVRSQVKRESLAAANLKRLEGVEVFLPKLRYQKVTRRGKVWWVEPLFPSYLLVRFDFTTLSRAVTYAQGVSKIVGFGAETPAIPDSFVAGLQAEVERYQDDTGDITVGWKVQKGDEVEVASGPFNGIEAEVVEVRSGTERVSLLIEFLGELKPIEMTLYDLILKERELPCDLQSGEPSGS